MPVEDHFTAKTDFVHNYNKLSTLVPVLKHWLGFSYIYSKDYDLYQNFDDTEFRKLYHTSNDKVKIFRENIVVIEEKWFGDMNLTDGSTFATDLIKREKLD